MTVGIDIARLVDDSIDPAEVQWVLAGPHSLVRVLRVLVSAHIHLYFLTRDMDQFYNRFHKLSLLLLLELHLVHPVL